MAEENGLQRLDALINRLIESDQAGDELSSFDLARELGEIRSLLMAMPTVHRTAEDLRHFRCGTCGTIMHGETAPERCTRCGKAAFLNVDSER